jgi:hypothetical protein
VADMKKVVIVAFILIIATLIFAAVTGWFGGGGRGSSEEAKVGFVNMNEAGLDEVKQAAFCYGKELVKQKEADIKTLREELKRVREDVYNTPRALELKEKIAPLLKAWENVEKLRSDGEKEKAEKAGEEFQELMLDPELSKSYQELHDIINVINSDEKVIEVNKQLKSINQEIDKAVRRKEAELTEEFCDKVKKISSDMRSNGFSVIIGVTECSDGKNVLKKFEILYADKKHTEDITDKVKVRLKFSD